MTETTNLRTLKQLKKEIEELIESEGENSPCLSFIFTTEEDLWWWEKDTHLRVGPDIGACPVGPSQEIATEVFSKAEEVFDYMRQAILTYCLEKAKILHYEKNRRFVEF